MLDCGFGLYDPSTVRIQNRDGRGFFDANGLNDPPRKQTPSPLVINPAEVNY